MEQKWILKDENHYDMIDCFYQKLKIPRNLGKILVSRGIDSVDKVMRYFKTDINDLYDPFLFADMEKAVERIIRAITNKEKILIYGDYDVDGITSVSLIYLYLQSIGADVSYYIPDRITEGYGISNTGIDEAKKRGATLIVSVDCGITAVDEIAYASSNQIDIIVSDHHEPGCNLPKAYALLDPKCENSAYPFHELAGVGVAYKLAQALNQKLNLDSELLEQYLDLVAIGTIADIVPLIDENRILVKDGLKRLNETRKPGLQALLNVTGLYSKTITTGQVIFIIAPRINAVGRMGDAERAVSLLTTLNAHQARSIASILESENRHRKDIDEITFKEALVCADQYFHTGQDFILVIDQDGWHPGVIGIVASRIVEKYYRPTIMISIEDGIGRGSARSISGFDIYSTLKQCEDLLVTFGGHKYAAGLTIEKKNIPAFRERVNAIAHDMMTEDLLVPKLNIDSELNFSEINDRFVHLLKLMAPFGPKNLRPVFMSRNLQVVGSPSIVGNNHLKFKVRQNNHVFDTIGFNLGNKYYRLAPGETSLDLAYVVEENEYLGRVNLQLRIKDLR
ncbi:single-stranded-DNA-specific exonuclease RecJ [candidate division KSB1 bacterium]|nr:single-stranded-DNA-specific exonuclease RecJ [candidate division KSB1 bacterium]